MNIFGIPVQGIKLKITALLPAILLPVLCISAAFGQSEEHFYIRYNGNGADSGSISDEYVHGTEITLKKNEKTAGSSDVPYAKNGCSFLGWSMKESADEGLVEIIPGGEIWTVDDEAIIHYYNEQIKGYTLYAWWNCSEGIIGNTGSSSVYIRYNGNGADRGSINRQMVNKGTSVTVKANADSKEGDLGLKRDGFIFDGWNTKPDGSGTAYKAGDTIVPDQDVTLYACWKAAPVPTATPKPTAVKTPVPLPTNILIAIETEPAVTEEPTVSPADNDGDAVELSELLARLQSSGGARPAPTRPAPTQTPVLPAELLPTAVPTRVTSTGTGDAVELSELLTLLQSSSAAKGAEVPEEGQVQMKLAGENDADVSDADAAADASSDEEHEEVPSASVPRQEGARNEHFVSESGQGFTWLADWNFELPETGITGNNAVMRSMKPASVHYQPARMDLQIPVLNLFTNIVSVEQQDGRYPIDWLESDSALLAETSVPGEGLSVIVGHNTLGAEKMGPFAGLAMLDAGDRFFVRDEENRIMIFEVYTNKRISPYDYDILYDTASAYESTMTLMTCEDERVDGGYAARRIVSARQVL